MDENSLRYEGWRVAGASGMGVLLAALVVYTFPIFLKPLAEEFSWSRGEVSFAYGITATMSALAAVPLGSLFDRLGPRPIVVTCLTLFGCVFASLSALTPRLWHLYVTFAVLGVLATGTSPIAYARAVSSWFNRRRGLALALAISGGSIGALIHPPATQALMESVGWRRSFLILGVLVLVVGVPIAARFIRERPSASHEADARAAGASVREGLRSRMFWILVAVLFCSSVIQNSAIVHFSALLTDRGVSAGRAALALSAFGAASIVGRFLTGWLVDRFFAPRVSFALLVIASLGSVALSGADSFATGALAGVMIGFGTGGESDVAPYLLSRYFGLRSFSTLYGFLWIAAASAGAVGPILMGVAFDVTGSYESLLVTLAIASLGVATPMLAMPRYDAPTVARSMPSL